LESGRVSSSPAKLVKEQSGFFRRLEKTVLAFREKLRKLFERVLQAIEDGQDTVSLKLQTVEDDGMDDPFDLD
jgi:hypothetical protein